MQKTTYRDLDLNFITHPLSKDIVKKYDEIAIKQSIKNLVLTRNYERPFHPEIGSQVQQILFDPATPVTKHLLETTITNTIQNFEPRVQLLKVVVQFDDSQYTVNIIIYFKIVSTERPLSIDFILTRTR
jgi:phage baseplate assembly protein W